MSRAKDATAPSVPKSRHKEELVWDDEHLKSISGKKPTAKYGSVSEALRHAIPEHRTCKSFCGGKKCKYCNVNNVGKWKPEQMEVEGLFSNWVTDNILAMARPITENVNKFDIMGQFQRLGITSIINLQLPGEHVTCGNGVEEGGFSYNQQDFMDNSIFFYNFGWQDYGVGSLSNILDMVKVMQFALSEGKVAVHCHAGLGRTGVMIACYLVFANHMVPDEAIHYVRSKRGGAIQTQSQIVCIQDFAKFLRPLRRIFHINHDSMSQDFTLMQFLTRQKHMLHGYEARRLKFIPKIVCVCCERLLQLAHRGHGYHRHKDGYSIMLKTAPSAFYRSPSSSSSSSSIITKSKSSTLHSVQSSLCLPDTMSSLSISPKRSVSLESFTAINASLRAKKSSRLKKNSSSSLLSSQSGLDIHESESDSGSLSADSLGNGAGGWVEILAQAMAETQYDPEITAAVQSFKERLNEDQHTYEELCHEKDPLILSALIWEWLDHLKEPILNLQDLPNLLEYANDPLAGLELLEKGARHTLQYFSDVIARLEPLPEALEMEVVQRLLSTLTHQNMVMEYHSLAAPDKATIRRTNNATGYMRDNVASRLVYYFTHLVHLSCKRLHEEQETKRQQEMEETGEEEEASGSHDNRGNLGDSGSEEEQEEEEEEQEEEEVTITSRGHKEKSFGKRRR